MSEEVSAIPMRILTVRQPWGTAIISLGKNVENRTRNIAGDYRGPIAIHTALREEPVGGEAAQRVRELTGYLPLFTARAGLGAIIGVVDLVGVHETSETGECRPAGLGMCSPWAEHDAWHLILANPRPLSEPIPYKGALGLRTISAELQARIEAAL